MRSDILRAAAEAHLSPILCRVALIVAEVQGEEEARSFVATCSLEDEAARLLDASSVPEASARKGAPGRPGHE